MPAPPLTCNAPLLIVVLCSVPLIITPWLDCILPTTSNASSGASVFMPTRKLESTRTTVLVILLFLTRMSMLDPPMLCCIIPALPSTPIVSSLLIP